MRLRARRARFGPSYYDNHPIDARMVQRLALGRWVQANLTLKDGKWSASVTMPNGRSYAADPAVFTRSAA